MTYPHPTGIAILAAGIGSRLSELTEQCPKPLLPFLGQPILAHVDDQLAGVAASRVAVNAFHLARKIEVWVQQRNAALPDDSMRAPWRAVRERYLSGSGGGLRTLVRAMRDCTTIVYVNADIVTDFPIDTLLAAHRHSGNPATMLVVPADSADGNVVYHPEKQQIVALPGRRSLAQSPRHGGSGEPVSFGGIAVLERSFIELLPPDPSPCVVRELLAPSLAEGLPIGSVFYDGPWSDLGTPKRWFDALELRGANAVDGFFPDAFSSFMLSERTLTDGNRSQRFLPAEDALALHTSLIERVSRPH